MTTWSRVLQLDDHELGMHALLSTLPPRYLRIGVVHVGAHLGQEVPVYRDFGYKNLWLIEANPDNARSLESKFAHDGAINVVATAIGDRVGTANLFVHTSSRTGSTEAASLLPLGEISGYSSLETPRVEAVAITSLDQMIAEGRLTAAMYNLLVVDVQGAERMVFEGAKAALEGFDAIITEVNMVPLWRGTPLEPQILDHLAGAGFDPVLSLDHEMFQGDKRCVAWGECLLIRR